ncbi:MAG TPA: DUF4382 domain-containing protein [Burkholderiaceae bacterium]|nr:DUF4382 domain-containing protein [Burkholderiaceae bacterium]
MNLIAKMLRQARWLGLACVTLFLAACGGGTGSGGTGIVRVSMTDAPSCYEHVYVTVSRVSIHRSATAEPNDGGWSHIDVAPQRVDLLTLTNGVLQELGEASVPAGRYSQIRLVLAPNGGTEPYANAVVLPGASAEIPLDTPSGQQSGLKLNAHLDVADGQVLDVVLDFDACKSVVQAGNSGKYLLKPVISVIPLLSSAGQAVEGYVARSIATGPDTATVTLQQGGAVVRATQPDPQTGRFVLSPVPVGTYTLVVTAPNRATAVLTGVTVSETSRTMVNAQGTPIDPPVSPTAVADGTVNETPAPAGGVDATVRALQNVGGGFVEVASQRIGGAAGETSVGYELNLPTAAPVSAAYAAGTGSITFTPASGAAGQYRLEASVPGKAAKTVDLTALPATEDFDF